MSPPVLHFWPGAGEAHRRTGARPVCGARAVPLLATPIPGRVTCARCLRVASPAISAARALGREDEPALWPDSELVALGMLAKDEPAASPRPAHYVNPNLEDPGRDPLHALVRRIRSRAEREAGLVRAALASVASELEDTLVRLRRGE